eukprot:CAMPEP_0201729104 /NCGR_PEP_ID=MMETSP0593-20130828/18000_1 /ASSEMBLY_ACC=CAM_ASM_000672 /TAXON_ID=267983 /ORGANISM="Skeletonema japonicum, Strain CCMP2506" /LENGTH=666 /DNA_ID=CAMNT_0048221391 /DNA_START=256 /DNA_END=2256 /DNA_ORIENTATION=+
MTPSNEGQDPSTPPQRTGLAHRRHHSIANDTLINNTDIILPTNNVLPNSAPRIGIRSSAASGGNNNSSRVIGRQQQHGRHATHSHFDLESTFRNENDDTTIRMAPNTNNKNSSAIMAMAQYLDTVESSDQVQDICSFQDVTLDDAENGKQTKHHHQHTNSSDSFHSNISSGSATTGTTTGGQQPRRARKMYYLLPMMWKHRYPIIACVAAFLACVIVISTSVKSSMRGVDSSGNHWKKDVPVVVDDQPPVGVDEMEMVGPPLEIEPDDDEDGGKGTIHQPQQPPVQTDEDGGALILGPGGVNEEDEEEPSSPSSSSSRTPCMSTTECETRADLLGFPTYEEGSFVSKGCYYEGSVVYWGTGATTTNDDEEENDLTLEELSTPFLLEEDGSSSSSSKNRLWCDEDEVKISIDKVTAALSIAEGEIDAEDGNNADVATVDEEEDVEFVEIQEQLHDPDGVAVVGAPLTIEEDTEDDGEGGVNHELIHDPDGVAVVGAPLTIEEDTEDDEEGDAFIVGAPLQIDSNPDDDIDAEWFATDTELYISLLAEKTGPHEAASKFCENKNKSLCNYNEYCPEGKSTRVYQGGPDGNWIENSAESEQWAPVLVHSGQSAADQWVQVGKIVDGGDASENFGQCWTYEEWMNRDDANMNVEDDIEESHRRFFLCCGN